MVPNVPLNPEAPEFYPVYHSQQITWPYTATPTAPPPPPLPPTEPPCQQREFLSLPPNCSFYLPTISAPLPFPDATNNTLLSSPPSNIQPPEPFLVVNEEVAVTDSPKQQQQQHQVFHEGFGGNNGRITNIRVGPRRSYQQQQQQARVFWKPKKVKEEKDEKQQEKLYGYGYGYGYGFGGKNNHLKGRQDFRRSSEYHGLNIFPKKKRGFFPLLPVHENGNETTVMIKNIPSRYTRDDLVKFLEDHCMVENSKVEQGFEKTTDVLAFDFVYLPIDFKKGFNKGYAFVNFTTPKAAWKFNITASNSKWDLYQSHKVRQVVAARIQGKENLEKRFESMNFPCESKEVLPVSFSVPRDGKNKSGEQKTLGFLVKPQYI